MKICKLKINQFLNLITCMCAAWLGVYKCKYLCMYIYAHVYMYMYYVL